MGLAEAVKLRRSIVLPGSYLDDKWQIAPAQQAVTAAASSNGMTHTDAPFSGSFWVPCANGGTGENVDITGTMTIDQQLLETKDGCQKFNFHLSLKQATGTGEVTGTTYTVQYRENAQQFVKWICSDACPSTITTTLNIGIRGKGSAENYTIHENVRTTTLVMIGRMTRNSSTDCQRAFGSQKRSDRTCDCCCICHIFFTFLKRTKALFQYFF